MLLTAVLASISITRIIFDGGTIPLILIQIQYMPLGAFSRAIYHHYQALNMRDITIASNKNTVEAPSILFIFQIARGKSKRKKII